MPGDIFVKRIEEQGLARLDPQALISQAVAMGAGIETMERLVALAKDVREIQAREAWYAAMAEFQRACPAIRKTATAKIQTRGGAAYSYNYAPLDEILSVIQPVLGPLGLSVSWRSRVEPMQVIVSCRISHTLGHHEESGDIAMPIVAGDGSGANPAQRVGIAATYAKRYALLGIIGMAPEDDDDAEGQEQQDAATGRAPHDETPGSPSDQDTITPPQQQRFWAIARKHGWTEEQVSDLLAGHKLNSTKEIPTGVYDAAIARLKQGPAAKSTSTPAPGVGG